ncbi:MAG: hypothetical protein KDD64_16225, partial [Bdellovibrionales bacterium]|nr:hypothetical protein [Bdellovibrionales bacterium]
ARLDQATLPSSFEVLESAPIVRQLQRELGKRDRLLVVAPPDSHNCIAIGRSGFVTHRRIYSMSEGVPRAEVKIEAGISLDRQAELAAEGRELLSRLEEFVRERGFEGPTKDGVLFLSPAWEWRA